MERDGGKKVVDEMTAEPCETLVCIVFHCLIYCFIGARCMKHMGLPKIQVSKSRRTLQVPVRTLVKRSPNGFVPALWGIPFQY